MVYRSGTQQPVTNSSLGAANARRGTLPIRARCSAHGGEYPCWAISSAIRPFLSTPRDRKNFCRLIVHLEHRERELDRQCDKHEHHQTGGSGGRICLRSSSWRECSSMWLVSGTGEDETPRRPKTRDVSGHSGRRPIRLAGRAYRKRVYEMEKVERLVAECGDGSSDPFDAPWS